MGAVKYDIQGKERIYTVKYALNTADGVRSLLRDRYSIAERRFKGDMAASDILIDLRSAIESAGLTDRQTEAVALVYGKWQLTQKEAAEVMGIDRVAVTQFIGGACSRMAEVYSRWNYGEVTVELPIKSIHEVQTDEFDIN